MPQPAPEESKPNFARLKNSKDLAIERFGRSDGLAIVKQTTLELAAHYATKYGLDSADPDVSVLTAALAFSRHKEFMLLQELERDLHERVLMSAEDETYAEALFQAARTGAHSSVHKEMDRLHARCKLYHKELKEIAGPGDIDKSK